MNKRKFYRHVESIIKRFIIFAQENSKNINLQKSIQSAIYNTTDRKKILLLNKNKQRLLVHSKDTVSKKLFIDYNINFLLIKKALKLLKKNQKRETLLNIGANIGSICIMPIEKKIFKKGIVFEPEMKNFRLLMANIYINGLESKIDAYKLALSDKEKNLKLSLNSQYNLGDNRILLKRNKNAKFEKVKSDKLDNFTSTLNKENTLIFMDTQGHEPYILKGGKKTIAKKIPMVLEFSPLLFDKNWIKNFSLLFKKYKYFYNLNEKKSNKIILNKDNLINLFNNLKLKKQYADLMIV